jgi:hypothetical protein
MVPLWELARYLGCHSQRRPENFSGRIFVIFQDDFLLLPGGTIFRFSVNTRAASGSFQQLALYFRFLPFPAVQPLSRSKISVYSTLRLPSGRGGAVVYSIINVDRRA